MFQFQISFGIRQNHGVLIVFCLRLLLDKIKYPLCTGKRVLKFGHDAGNLVERLRILVRIGQKAGELSYTDGSCNSA